MSSNVKHTNSGKMESNLHSWEFPSEEAEEAGFSSSPLFREHDSHSGLELNKSGKLTITEAEEDPLLVVFQDEEEEEPTKKEEEDSNKSKAKKCKWVTLLLVFLGLLFILIPILFLIVDRNKAEERLRAPGAITLGSVSVDVSQALPVVGLQVSVLKSAFPKHTHLDPQFLECQAFSYEWGNMVATIHEVQANTEDDSRIFYLNATLEATETNPYQDQDAIAEVTLVYATIAWQLLTGQRKQEVTKYNCQLHLNTKLWNRIHWKHVQDESGLLHLNKLWGEQEKPATAIDTDMPSWMILPDQQEQDKAQNLPYYDYHTGTVWDNNNGQYEEGMAHYVVPYGGDDDVQDSFEENSGPRPSNHAIISNAPTSAPTLSPNTPSPTNHPNTTHAEQPDDAPIALSKPQTTTTNPPTTATPTPKNAIVIHKMSADGILLGIRLQLPKSILESIPQFQVKLPPIQLQVVQKQSQSQQAIQMSIQDLDLSFSSLSNQHYALAQVACGNSNDNTNSDEPSCSWYSPLVSLLSDTLQMNTQERGYGQQVVSIAVNANQSFLEQMVGHHHDIVLYRLQMSHLYGHLPNKRQRRFLQDSSVQVDCIRAQDALFGDIFELNWCMNLKWSEGVVLDGSVNLYGYGGSLSSDMEWQQTDGNILRLDGSAQVDLELQSDSDTKMDLAGSAVLDLDNLKVAVYANNTADWWPFRMVLEASVEYLDPEDSVVFRLDNATLEVDKELYVHATGDARLDNPNSKVTVVINDPRLDVAMDGTIADDGAGLSATWAVLYDGENIITGESELAASGDQSCDYYYNSYYDDDGWLTVFNGPSCGGTASLQFESESNGKLTTDLKAGIESTGDGFEVYIKKGELEWAGEKLADVALSFELDNQPGLSLLFEEKIQDHEIKFDIEMHPDYTFKVDAEGGVRLSGQKLFSTTSQVWLQDDNSLQATSSGEAGEHEYSMSVMTEWNSESPYLLEVELKDVLLEVDDEVWVKASGNVQVLEPNSQDKYAGEVTLEGEVASRNFDMEIAGDLQFGETQLLDYDGTSSLTVDDNLLWSERGRFKLEGVDYDYTGEMELETTKNDADVQLEALLKCSWDDEKGTFSCDMSKMMLDFEGAPITDSVGDMKLDLQESEMTLDLKDDYTEDKDGYVVSFSGNYEDDILTGTVADFKMVSNGDTTMDASGRMTLNLGDVSVAYVLEDLISETLMGLDYGGMAMVYNDWDELETFDIRAENMRMVMQGDPWVHGGMHMGLDMVDATISLAMDNNTTKLPIDFDFTISIGEEEVSMALSAVSSPPPSPPTPVPVEAPTGAPPTLVTVNTTILIYNLEGLTSEALNDAENREILEQAFEDFVKNLIESLAEDGASSERKLTTRRRLGVTLVADTATVYGVVDVDCPQGDESIPANATCQTIQGKYDLMVVDEDPMVVSAKYEQATDKAVEEGKLQESIKAVDPDYPVVVLRPMERASAPETAIPILTSSETQAPTESGSPGICHGLSGFTLAWAVASLLVL